MLERKLFKKMFKLFFQNQLRNTIFLSITFINIKKKKLYNITIMSKIHLLLYRHQSFLRCFTVKTYV